MIVVVDASVALKWFFRERDDEDDVERALAILHALDERRIEMVQPPHFLAEIAAVLAREKPDDARADLAELQRVDWRRLESGSIYQAAVDLASRLGHHLFDTLYHATALQLTGATMVTADRRYHTAAGDMGRIKLLRDFAC